ncbi:RcnB family protein [Variovorax sp. VNK109]|uniref:RcnB family protein n=1 Tax=Variovorax sp. VNK109 TaxID=3400919 RepID=UPI003C0732C4
MKTSSKIALALAMTMGVTAVASAQPRYDHGHGNNGRGPDRVVVVRDARHAPPPVRYVRVDDHRRYDNRHFVRYHRGDRMPAAYRGQRYVVNDYRAYHLSAPPRGHQWVKDGNDFALVAIATGVIASLILAR